jgi:hypothetical protein
MRLWAIVPSFIARDPAMLKWSGLLVQLGGRSKLHFFEDFFSHLDQDIFIVDDYGYAGIDFRNDPDLVLPEGYNWDASLGMLDLFCFLAVIYFFDAFHSFICFWCLTQFSLFCTDRALLRPTGMSPLVRRGAAHGGVGPIGTTGEYDTNLDEVEESLTQLMISVPLTRDEDIPIRMRRHANGGGSRFARLFHKVNRAVVCDSEHHHDD